MSLFYILYCVENAQIPKLDQLTASRLNTPQPKRAPTDFPKWKHVEKQVQPLPTNIGSVFVPYNNELTTFSAAIKKHLYSPSVRGFTKTVLTRVGDKGFG